MAPEVLKKNYNQKCDIWSCGVILYILLSGQLPFKGKTKKAIMDQIIAGTYDFAGKEWSLVSEKAKNFVAKLMNYNPDERLSAEQALADPWILELTHNKKNEPDDQMTLNALGNLKTYRVRFSAI